MWASSRRSCPSTFQPSTKRRIYRFDNNGDRGAPCGVPRRSSLARVVRWWRPRSSISSTGDSSHVAISARRCRSLTRRETDFMAHGANSVPSGLSVATDTGRLYGGLFRRGEAPAMDFSLIDYLDEGACYTKLLDLLHPDGLSCPHCGQRQ